MTDLAPGWPCALLPTVAPSVSDCLSAPTGDTILPQLLQLTPRGPAWGTDEAGSGQGAEATMLEVWRAVAGHAAQNYATDFELGTQCFPSAVTYSLEDWEAEYGLPDTCASGQAGVAQRIAALRARFGAIGGQSPAYFVCLAASLGYDILIEEPGQFLIDTSECAGTGTFEDWFVCDDGRCDDTPLETFVLDGDADPNNHNDQVSDESVWKYWIVHIAALGETYFEIDEGEIEYDPLEGFFTPRDLECVFRRVCPPHTVLVFDFTSLPSLGSLNASIRGNLAPLMMLF